MRVCPLCQARYDEDVRKCPHDGRRPLSEAVVSTAAGDTLLGATLADRYTIVGRVGAGGMGTVYRAEQAPMNREIALKVLRKDLGRDAETVARFHREAHTLSALKHPNTVTIFDFGQTEDGLLFLAMELLEGEMLSSRLKRVGPMDVPLAIRIAAGVLRSLGEAHERGIIHRDLKPDNIFLAKVHGRPEEDEIVKVVDFGIAKIRDGERGIEPLQTQEGTVFGTPRYMSPEQAQGKTLDGRSDLYAVGVLLFHMLTGRAPFTDDDAVIVMAHHIKTVPPPVRQLATERAIPQSLEALVARALEKDPANRPQTAEAFLAELEQTQDEARALAAAALAPPPAEIPAPPPNAIPRSAWAGAGALAVLAIVAGIALALPHGRSGATGAASVQGAVTESGAGTLNPRAAPTGRPSAPAAPGAPAADGASAQVPAAGSVAAPSVGDARDASAQASDAVVEEPATTPGSAGTGRRTGAGTQRGGHHGGSHQGGSQPYHRWQD